MRSCIKDSVERLGTFGVFNAWRSIIHNIAAHIISLNKNDKWYLNNITLFHITCDLADFENQDMMQSHKDDTIQFAFG